MSETPSANTRVLVVCNEEMLTLTRELVLRRAGYQVDSLTSTDLGQLPDARAYDVLVVCHSVPSAEAQKMVQAMKAQNPRLVTICLMPYGNCPTAGFDATCDSGMGPVRLLEQFRAAWARASSQSVSLQGLPGTHFGSARTLSLPATPLPHNQVR